MSHNQNCTPYENVVVLDDEDQNLGQMLYKDAQYLAFQKNLDVVVINQQGGTKVCKITDAGRWKYLQKKGQKKQAVRKLKEMNYNVGTEKHDLEVKTNHVREFLKHGDDVLLVVNMKGREKGNPNLAKEKLYSIVSSLSGIIKEIKSEDVKATGKSVTVTVHPV